MRPSNIRVLLRHTAPTANIRPFSSTSSIHASQALTPPPPNGPGFPGTQSPGKSLDGPTAASSGTISPSARSDSTRPLHTALRSRAPLPLNPHGPAFSTAAAGGADQKEMSFDNPAIAYGKKSALDLALAYLVFRMCTIGPLTRNAETVMRTAKSIFGEALVDGVVKRTFFKHFCGGENTDDLRPCIDMLKANGINGILDYAAENAPDAVEVAEVSHDEVAHDMTAYEHVQPAQTYEYTTEEDCDFHVEVFKSCITAVKDVTPQGFAALKLTALGNPKLLERMSTAIVETARLFERFDIDGDEVITHEEFEFVYRDLFMDADEKLPELIPLLDPNNSGVIDYVEWSKLLQVHDLPRIVAGCKTVGPLYKAAPNPEELKLMLNMRRRLWEVAEHAAKNDVSLLIDAEQTYYQPAVDNFVIKLMKAFNKTKPIIYNTYQCYLKGTRARVKMDLDRATRNDFHFSAKLVRGAYMNAERARAEEMGYESPIMETEEATHEQYDGIVEMLIRDRVERGTSAEIMVASHNRTSVESAVSIMKELGTRDGVHFAQLLGMRDDLTFNLGNSGYKAYKYVPYGKVNEVMPYLLRRAQENSDITKGMGDEIRMIEKEFKRRWS